MTWLWPVYIDATALFSLLLSSVAIGIAVERWRADHHYLESPPMAVKPLTPNPVHVSASAFIANITRAEWDGTPPQPELSRPHFLVFRESEGEPDIADWHDGKWWMPGVNEGYSTDAVAKAYRYIGPAARPEAEALAEAYCDFVLKQDAMNSIANRDDKPLLAWQAARDRLQQAELAYRAAVRRG